MKRLVPRLTYANVVATLALVIAVGGASAFAASKLPKNSVGTKQLKNNAVTGAKIKDGSVSAAKLAAGAIGTVPRATNAAHADTASSAASAALATNADNAASLGGRGPDSFASATVVRTAQINGAGVVNPARSFGISQANVSRTSKGIYCISGLPSTPITTVTSLPFGSFVDTTVVSEPSEEGPCQVNISIYKISPSELRDDPFSIFIR